MYKAFFGLRERPFDLTANPRFLFLSKGHREALSLLHYGIAGDKGLTLLLGEAGTGKTTVLRAACQQQTEPAIQSMHLPHPAVSRDELHDFIAFELRLAPATTGSRVASLRRLYQTLHERRASGRHTVLVIDEAQLVPDELFDEIRMLANLESPAGKLLAVVLTGQPELAERLNEPHLRPFKQRIALRTTLPALSLQETAGYIASRVRTAGGSAADIFSSSAVEAVHRASRGIARTISVVCDNALIAAFASSQRMITDTLIGEVCVDLDLDVAPMLPAGHALAPVDLPRLETPADIVEPLETVPVTLLATPANPLAPIEASIVPAAPDAAATDAVAARGRMFAVPK
jgi:general secretion pathway protein A